MPAYQKKGVPNCPACDEPLERVGRAALMRVLIGSKRYYCRHCFRGYLSFLGYLLPL
jgi:hypothetical protein